MRADLRMAPFLAVLLVLTTIPVPAAAESTYVDDFPQGLSNYRTGGWQWPFNDGTGAGNVTAGPDNWTVYFDATYNALAYAIRQTPEMYDFTVTTDFVIPTRDSTPGDQLFFYLRWNDTTYPDQSGCPNCSFPMPHSGILVDFFLGEGRLFLAEVGHAQTTGRVFELTVGRAHSVAVQLSGETGRVYVDGAQVLEATNLTSPSGLFGITAYRVDLIVDQVRIDVIHTTAGPALPSTPSSGPPGISLASPWIVAPAAFFVGVAAAFFAQGFFRRMRRDRRQP